jgi:gluconate kinase
LIDVSETTAQNRIDTRQGHFYKGKLKGSISETDDNAEWEFAPVDFDHILLDGLKPIEENAQHLVGIVLSNSKRIPVFNK